MISGLLSRIFYKYIPGGKIILEIGKIINTHGLKGEVKAFLVSDDPDKLEKLDYVFAVFAKGEKRLKISSFRRQKQLFIIKFEGIDNIDAAIELKGASIKVPVSQGVPLGEGEYYLKDIYDMRVIDETGVFLGVITEIYFTGANDVYQVSAEGKKPFLLPAIKQCILDVDTENKTMRVRLMEGLVE